MATQAQITINGTAGSNTDLLLNSVVQLNNDGLGGEVTYEWALLSQPAGTPSAVLSSTSIQSPTFTVNKEGTYLIRLIVNKGLADEKTDTVIAAVRELETRNRIPAVGETTENGLDEGWAIGAVNDILQRVTRLTDSGMFVAYASEALQAGNVVHMSGMYTLAAGLPGERKVPTVNKALATVPEYTDGPLGVVISDVAGNPAVTMGELCRVMVIGALPAYNLGAGGTVGAPVYVDDNALLSLTPGTNVRSVGDIAYDHGDNTYDIAISSIASSLPTGTAGGDLDNFYPNPTVAGIHGKAIDVPGVNGDVPYYDTGTSTIKWGPQLLGGKVVDPAIVGYRYPYYDSVTDTIKWDGVTRLQGKAVNAPTTDNTLPYYDSATSTIKWGAVTADRLADNAVTTAKILDGNVTATKVTTTFVNAFINAGSAVSAVWVDVAGSTIVTSAFGASFKVRVGPQSGTDFYLTGNNSSSSQENNSQIRVHITDGSGGVSTFSYRTAVPRSTNNVNLTLPDVLYASAFGGPYTIKLQVQVAVGTGTITWSPMLLVAYAP